MHLETITISVIIILTAGCLSLAKFLEASRDSANKHFLMWGAGNASLALGWLLLTLRGIIPDFISIVIANTLISLCHALLLNGVQRFIGVRRNWFISGSIVAAIFLGQWFWLAIGAPVTVRIVYVPSLLALHAFLTSWHLFHFIDRRIAYQSRATAFVFLVLGIVYVSVAAGFVLPMEKMSGLFDPSTGVTVLFLAILMGVIGWSIGLASMVSARHHFESIDRENALQSARNEIQQSEERYRELYSNMGTCVAIYEGVDGGRDFVFKDLNHATEKTENIKAVEVLGRRVTEVFPRVVEFGLLDVFQRVWKTGRSEHFPLAFYEDDRISGWRENYVYKLPTNEIVAVYEDRTEQKRAEENLRRARDELETRVEERTVALRESEEHFRILFENALIGIGRVRLSDGKVLLANNRFASIFGYESPEECVAHCYSADHYVNPEERAPIIAALERDISVFFENRLTKKNGAGITVAGYGKADLEQGHTDIVMMDITEQKRAETALRESEARFRSVVDSSLSAIALRDRDGRIILVNKTYAEWTNAEASEIIGLKVLDLFPGDQGKEIDSYDRQVLDTGKPLIIEAARSFRDGVARIVLIHKCPIFSDAGEITAVASVITDITDLKQAQEAAETSEARLAEIVDIAPEAVITIGADMKIQLFNQGAERIFGHSAKEAHGRTLDMLLPEKIREDHRKLVEEFANSSDTHRLMNQRKEVMGIRKDGSMFPASASVSKLEIRGERIFTVMLHDITAHKLAEEGRRLALVKAESANRAKSEFLATMSHELRTPLNAINGFAEVIATETLGPVGNAKYREYAIDILDSGQHLLGLINDILDLSKIETGEDQLHEGAVEIPEIVRSALKLVRQRAEQGGIELELELPDRLPSLRADKRKLKQILVNLLSNAVKFTDNGGEVTFRIWYRMDSGYVFQITDTGIGIALEDIPKALSRFGQVDGDLNRQYEGTGLGLPLTKAFVELHGGSLDLQSVVGVGTTVTVRFPAERIVASLDNAASSDTQDRAAS